MILIVDDNQELRELIVDSLATCGYTNVVVAECGLDALKVLEAHPIELVVTDWNMPGLCGLGLTRKIRATRGPNLPVLLVTANTSARERSQAFAAGCDDVLGKPFTIQAMRAKVKELIGTPMSASYLQAAE